MRIFLITLSLLALSSPALGKVKELNQGTNEDFIHFCGKRYHVPAHTPDKTEEYYRGISKVPSHYNIFVITYVACDGQVYAIEVGRVD